VADRNAYTAVKAQWQDIQRAKRGEVIVDANTRFERRATVTKLGKKSKRTKLAAIQQKGIEPSASNVKVLRHVYASEATALQGPRLHGRSCSVVRRNSASSWQKAGRNCSPNCRPRWWASSPSSTARRGSSTS
jgi:phage protein D